MLSEPLTETDVRALLALVQTQNDHGVSEAQRRRLRAMGLVSPALPYELTDRARRLTVGDLLLVLGMMLALFVVGCGGVPFELGGEPTDAGPLDAPSSSTSSSDVAGDVVKGEAQARDQGAPVDVVDAAQTLDAAPDAPHDGAAAADVGAPDVPELVDAGGPRDAGNPDIGPPDAGPPPMCTPSETTTLATSASGCTCETPPTYSCFATGVVCGDCPPTVDASAFGHADGSCKTPGVCMVGAPCHWQAVSGAVVAGSVVSCP